MAPSSIVHPLRLVLLAGLCASLGAVAAENVAPKATKPKARPSAAAKAASAPAKAQAAEPAASAPKLGKDVFATVGNTIVSSADYQRALAVAVRKKYYHAKPPEAELAAFQREVGDDLVNRVLLLAEAQRRGLKADAAKIQATVAGYDKQYAASPNWAANRDKMLAAVVPQLERENLLEQIERQVKSVPEPSDEVTRAYYEQHKDLFVEPEQVKLSVILLKVDPASPVAVWKSAEAEGQRVHAKLKAGADFGELARLHSADRSAANGGQMEYVHRGMLPEAVQKVVDPLAPGALAEPVRLLEGVAVLRLDDRKKAQQRAFDEVKTRAGDLWQRDEGQARWKQLIAQLRRGTPIVIDESHYAPLRPTAAPARDTKPGAS